MRLSNVWACEQTMAGGQDVSARINIVPTAEQQRQTRGGLHVLLPALAQVPSLGTTNLAAILGVNGHSLLTCAKLLSRVETAGNWPSTRPPVPCCKGINTQFVCLMKVHRTLWRCAVIPLCGLTRT
jgi:hypothetical protein